MLKLTIVVLTVFFFSPFSSAQTTIIPFGSSWKYLDNGSNQGTGWRSISFDDASWKNGLAELGYGDGDEATVVSYGSNSENKYITTYFRKTIAINDASTYKDYKLSIKRDDGAIVYINGIEVYRTNMPTGTISYSTFASANATSDGNPPLVVTLSSSSLKTGTNVIAVEVHQKDLNSSDLSFNLELIGNTSTTDKTPPAVVSINRFSPSTESTNATSVIFRTTFSETVTGVNSTDFSLRGTATGTISAVSGSSTTYDITVKDITGTGSLGIDLKSSGTGIIDAAGNAITSGYTDGQTYTITTTTPPPPSGNGFVSVTALKPISMKDNTGYKPQAKAWIHAGKWWCVVPEASSGGTRIFRLDGTSWTPVLNLLSSSSRADCWVVGDIVHILMFKGGSTTSYIASVQYDAGAGTYKFWSKRSTNSSIKLPSGAETATLTVDGAGRMWVATAGVSDVYVWWSDSPYSSWSSPITIASGVKDDDICAITKLPGKIGVLWSNQNTRRFGFKTHSDGSSPTSWSADEKPASQSAIDNVGAGMADDHINVIVGSDGTLYSAIKTGYDKSGYTQLGLLIRRTSGSWDKLYTVSTHSEGGTQPIIILNEALGKLKVVYTTLTDGGYIAYKESSVSSISFGSSKILINSGGLVYNFVTSTHQTYHPTIVIMATKINTSPFQAVSILASDGGNDLATTSVGVKNVNVPLETFKEAGSLQLYPNPFYSNATLTFNIIKAGYYTIELYDSKGMLIKLLKQGWSEAGIQNTTLMDGSSLKVGMYIIRLQSGKESKVLKLMKN